MEKIKEEPLKEGPMKEEPLNEEPKVFTTEEDLEKKGNAVKVVKKYMYWSMGVGLLPGPLLDVAAVTGVQLKMLSEISKIYDVKFSENAGKSIIAALLGGVTAGALTRSSFTSFIKTIPVIGILGSLSMPIYSGAATWAIGKVFVHHFAMGGTFLNFDPQKVKDYFEKLYKEGKDIASNMRTAKAN